MNEIAHFQDYGWKAGKPVGKGTVSPEALSSFRILTDPYKKRYSIEKYISGQFLEVVYDSNLFDFRHLKRADEAAWQREILNETSTSMRAIIRSIDERVILIEEAEFEGDVCRLCRIYSPHGIWIATQKMLHKALGDDFDGVALFDRLDHPILIKRYAKDDRGAFSTLLSETWEH